MYPHYNYGYHAIPPNLAGFNNSFNMPNHCNFFNKDYMMGPNFIRQQQAPPPSTPYLGEYLKNRSSNYFI